MSTEFENLGAGVHRYWLHNRKIMIYELVANPPGAGFRERIDIWADAVIAAIKEWSVDHPYLVLHDFTHAPFSRYGVMRSEQINKNLPKELKGRAALIIPQTPIGHIIKLTAITVQLMVKDQIETRFFFERDKGLAWLEELL